MEFGKDYSGDPGEEVDRIKIWMENKARIERHNREFLEAEQIKLFDLIRIVLIEIMFRENIVTPSE